MVYGLTKHKNKTVNIKIGFYNINFENRLLNIKVFKSIFTFAYIN